MADPRICVTCRGDTLRIFTVGGRWFTVDATPHPDGIIVPIRVNGIVRGTVLTGDQLPAQQPAWRVHNCAPSTKHAPRCTVCSLPMHPGLARLERWTTHPSCDPTDHAAAARAAARQKR